MSVSYVRVNFKNRVVERPRTYIITTNGDGSVTLTPAFGEVEEAGVPLNAENLNKMDYIEKLAREELGMTRQGELPYSPGTAGRKQANP